MIGNVLLVMVVVGVISGYVECCEAMKILSMILCAAVCGIVCGLMLMVRVVVEQRPAGR